MRSTTRTSRATRAAIAAAGVIAVSAAAATPANAALGGANPSNFTNNPNLRTVTVEDQGTSVVALYTFDKPLDQVNANAARFTLGSYAASNREIGTAATLVSGKPNVVEVVFDDPANAVDADDVTHASVTSGTVRSQLVNSKFNLGDSVAISNGKSKSGTRGLTAGPDLVGVEVDSSNINGNRLLFTFDQKVDAYDTANPDRFRFVTNTGTLRQGNLVTKENDFTVGVRFPNGVSVLDAKRGIVLPGVAVAPNGLPNPPAAEALPGTNGITARPDLISAEAATSGGNTTVNFVYDEAVTSADFADFSLFTGADNGPIPGVADAINADGKSVTVTFPGIVSQFNEHLVYASAASGAVTGTGGASYTDGAPVGGNAGANASGFTSAPEALSTTFDKNSGNVSVTYDARLISIGIIPGIGINPANVKLIGADGIVVPGADPVVTTDGGSANPAQVTVDYKFAPDQVKAASAIQFAGHGGVLGLPGIGDFSYFGANALADVEDAANVQQILSPTATASAVAPVGTPKSAFRFAKPTTTAVLPASVTKALKPTKSKSQAKKNAKIVAKFYAGKKGYRVTVKKAATK